MAETTGPIFTNAEIARIEQPGLFEEFRPRNLPLTPASPSSGTPVPAEPAAEIAAVDSKERTFPTGKAEQLWRTWAYAGLAGRPGLNVYAVSPGLNERARNPSKILEQLFSFELPDGVRLETRPGDIPVSMIFAFSEQEPLISHRAYIGRDVVGRPGNYFSHMLTDLPENFTARDAVRLWGSPFWQVAINKVKPGKTLPTVDVTTLEPKPIETVFEKEGEGLIANMICTYLTAEQTEKIIVVGIPEDTIAMINVLTKALPLEMIRNLTFDTYAVRPGASLAKIVGAVDLRLVDGKFDEKRASTPQFLTSRDTARGFVINCLEPNLSILPEGIDEAVLNYAQFAAAQLVEGGDLQSLTQFINQAEKDGIHTLEGLLSEYEKYKPSPG